MLYYKCHKRNFKCWGSYIDPPYWIKNKKAIINLKNEDDKCFQYPATNPLNNDKIKREPQRLSKS